MWERFALRCVRAFVSQIFLYTATSEVVSSCLFEYAYVIWNMFTGLILEHEGKGVYFSKTFCIVFVFGKEHHVGYNSRIAVLQSMGTAPCQQTLGHGFWVNLSAGYSQGHYKLFDLSV